MKKQNLEMLQLLESIEVMLQNGNSIHPDSVIRGAIRLSIGMDQYGMPEGLDTPEKHEQYLKDIGLMKQTAVEWYANQAMKLETKRQSGKISTEQMVNELIKVLNQANEMFREQMIGFAKNFEHIDINKSDMENELNCYLNLEDTEELLKETFKSE